MHQAQQQFVPSAMKRITQPSVHQMLVTIGRAYLASGQHFAVSGIKLLPYTRLLGEFHWAIAYLSAKGLLSDIEEIRAEQYAEDFLEGPFSDSN